MADEFEFLELIDEFREEASRQIQQLDDALLACEQDGPLDEEARQSLLRALHTLKGNAGMLGFGPIRDLVHTFETVFKSARSRSRGEMDTLFEAAAALRAAVESAATDTQQAAFEPLARHARAMEAGVAAEPASPSASATEPEEPGPTGDELVRVRFSKLDDLMNRVGELLGLAESLSDLVKRHRKALASIELRRLLEDRTEDLDRLAADLHDTAIGLRLVPIRRVFGRFPSLARELAREKDKRVRLTMEGLDTHLDKSTADALAEPLLHLVRNAVDHGIEAPEERRRKGKPEEGRILLRAERRGDRVRIVCEDDGAGLDPREIVDRARESGILAPDEDVPAEDAVALILRAGFSTRGEPDAVSGRGVGLDVARRSIRRLRGELVVEVPEEAGTRFVMDVPLTVAITPALLLEVADEIVALPVAAVEQTLKAPEIERAGVTPVFRHGDRVIPVADLGRLFGWRETAGGTRLLAIVRAGSRSLALRADRLLEQRDVVVEAVPRFLGPLPAVSAVTVVPGGRVILLLEPGGLLDMNARENGSDSTG